MLQHRLTNKLLAAGLILFSSSLALAQNDANGPGLILNSSFSIRQVTGVQRGNQTNYHVNVRGGYRIASGWYFGMIYARQIANGAYATNQAAIGNSVGYYYGNAPLITSYFLTATHSEKSPTGTIRRTEGSGFQVDLSYLFPIATGLTFGPTLTYKSLTFLKQEADSTTYLIDKHSETYIYPYISLAYTY